MNAIRIGLGENVSCLLVGYRDKSEGFEVWAFPFKPAVATTGLASPGGPWHSPCSQTGHLSLECLLVF